MKYLILCLSAVFLASSVIGDDAAPRRKKFNKKAAYLARVAANGGLVTRPYAGKYVVIVNDQKRVAEADFFDPKQSIEMLFQFPVKVVPAGTDVSNAGVVITISDNATAPALLVAPEAPWAGINVAALAADKPSQDILNLRMKKEIWRAFMYACGAANSVMQPCVMRPIFGLRDLDAQDVTVPCPDSLNRVVTCAKALGIGETSRCMYRQACQEGWAPAPTNDVQKKIWKEVHDMPQNPMKIEFDPKKGR